MKRNCSCISKLNEIAIFVCFTAFVLLPVTAFSSTEDSESFYSTAVLDFSVRNPRQEGMGKEVAMLLTSFLSDNPQLIMVERQEIETLISEQALGKSGTVKKDTAAMVGQLTGAKIIITGTIMSLGNEQTLIAKIMGTETSRVLGVNEKVGVKGSMTDACMLLAEKINDKISQSADVLVAKNESPKEFIEEKKATLKDKELPTVSVKIKEMHIGQVSVDPAAETEVSYILQQLGFKVIDQGKAVEQPDIEITGEAFSENGIKRGDFTSCKGRVELKAINRKSGNILSIDRQAEVGVDISQQIAGKSAIQTAAAKLTERMVDKIVQ